MANKKSFTGWCHVSPDGSITQEVFYTRKDTIRYWRQIAEGATWKQLYRYGHRIVKVEVKIIER